MLLNIYNPFKEFFSEREQENGAVAGKGDEIKEIVMEVIQWRENWWCRREKGKLWEKSLDKRRWNPVEKVALGETHTVQLL